MIAWLQRKRPRGSPRLTILGRKLKKAHGLPTELTEADVRWFRECLEPKKARGWPKWKKYTDDDVAWMRREIETLKSGRGVSTREAIRLITLSAAHERHPDSPRDAAALARKGMVRIKKLLARRKPVSMRK